MKINKYLHFHIVFAAALLSASFILHAETLSRPEAIKIALENNPDIAAAKNEWEESLARVSQEKAFPDPEFEIEFEELPSDMSLGDYGERNIGFVQQFEYPMKWFYRLKAAKRYSEATKLAVYEKAKLDIVYSVKEGYDKVLVNAKILEYEEINSELLEEFYDKAKVRYESGAVSNLEILRAEVEYGRSVSRVMRAKSDLLVSKAELNTILARTGDSPLELKDELVYTPIEISESALTDTALENRPDFLGASLHLESLKAGKSEMKASLFPDLNVGMFRQTVQEPLTKENYWRVSLALEIPLWGFYRQRGVINEASAEIRKEIATQNSLRSNIMLEVKTALHEFNLSCEMMALFNGKILGIAEKSYEAAESSYEEGKATYLELMDARKALTETRIEYTETLYNYRLSLINLERAIGIDIETVSK
ncbi:TolC family protein [Candidatus Latescibacterota bacterium]